MFTEVIQIQETFRIFCVLWFLFKIFEKDALVIIRQHQQIPYNKLILLRYIGKTAAGIVYEQAVSMTSELRAAHPHNDINQEISEYYLAEEISSFNPCRNGYRSE